MQDLAKKKVRTSLRKENVIKVLLRLTTLVQNSKNVLVFFVKYIYKIGIYIILQFHERKILSKQAIDQTKIQIWSLCELLQSVSEYISATLLLI